MSAEVSKFTIDQVESLELAPGVERSNLEGWVPELAAEEEVRSALEKAFDYRGDVTLTLKSGERIEGYIFNRVSGPSLVASQVHYFAKNATARAAVSYADIARIEFTGKDCAAGKQWEDWVRKHAQRKAAGEKGIGLHPEALE